MLLKKTTRHWPPRTPSPCPAHVHPGFLELPEATLATQPPSLQLLLRLLHAYGAWKQLLRRVLPPGTERRSGFTHTSVKVKCATPEGCSSSAVCPPGRVHLGAAGGRLQCAPTALQSRHQTGEWQQDLSPALRATMKKKTRLRGSLPFNYLKRKSKPMATSYAPTQEGTA